MGLRYLTVPVTVLRRRPKNAWLGEQILPPVVNQTRRAQDVLTEQPEQWTRPTQQGAAGWISAVTITPPPPPGGDTGFFKSRVVLPEIPPPEFFRKTGGWIPSAVAAADQIGWARKRSDFPDPVLGFAIRQTGAWLGTQAAAPSDAMGWAKKRVVVPDPDPELSVWETGGWNSPQQGPPANDSIPYTHRFRDSYEDAPVEFSPVTSHPAGAIYSRQPAATRWFIKT